MGSVGWAHQLPAEFGLYNVELRRQNRLDLGPDNVQLLPPTFILEYDAVAAELLVYTPRAMTRGGGMPG